MGVSLLAYFAPVILQGIGADSSLTSVLSGVISTAFFLGTIPTCKYIAESSLCLIDPDRIAQIGRLRSSEGGLSCESSYLTGKGVCVHANALYRIWSAVGSTVFFIAFIACVAVNNTVSNWTAIGLLFPIIFCQVHGWQATKFLYSSEIAPLQYRHIGAAFFAAGEWLMVFLTVMAGPIGLEVCGWPFWFFIL